MAVNFKSKVTPILIRSCLHSLLSAHFLPFSLACATRQVIVPTFLHLLHLLHLLPVIIVTHSSVIKDLPAKQSRLPPLLLPLPTISDHLTWQLAAVHLWHHLLVAFLLLFIELSLSAPFDFSFPLSVPLALHYVVLMILHRLSGLFFIHDDFEGPLREFFLFLSFERIMLWFVTSYGLDYVLWICLSKRVVIV